MDVALELVTSQRRLVALGEVDSCWCVFLLVGVWCVLVMDSFNG